MRAVPRLEIVRITGKAESGMKRQFQKQALASQKSKLSEQKKKHDSDLLDEALEETFPASDPVAMLEPVHHLHQPKEEKGT